MQSLLLPLWKGGSLCSSSAASPHQLAVSAQGAPAARAYGWRCPAPLGSPRQAAAAWGARPCPSRTESAGSASRTPHGPDTPTGAVCCCAGILQGFRGVSLQALLGCVQGAGTAAGGRTVEEHVVHHLLLGQRVNAHQAQRLVWERHGHTQVRLAVNLVLRHEHLDLLAACGSHCAQQAAQQGQDWCTAPARRHSAGNWATPWSHRLLKTDSLPASTDLCPTAANAQKPLLRSRAPTLSERRRARSVLGQNSEALQGGSVPCEGRDCTRGAPLRCRPDSPRRLQGAGSGGRLCCRLEPEQI